MKKVAYIAGAMSGIKDNNRAAFFEMQRELDSSGEFVALNPAMLPEGLTQAQYMDICLAMVRSCDCVVMLEGWTISDGAVAEHALAKKLKKIIFNMDELDEVTV